MKKIFFFLIIFNSISTFAQKTDLVNAPENPIALKFKLEHFNLKGDVFSYDSKYYFNKEGFLTSKSDYEGDNTYTYKDGKLEFYPTNEAGYITKIRNFKYDYNNNGLLITTTENIKNFGKEDAVNQTKYTYNNLNRVILEEQYKNGMPYKTKTYTYKKLGDILQVNTEEKEGSRTLYFTEKHYKNGRLVFSKSSLDTIELKIESKLDTKGNSIEDKHINNGKLTDTFAFSIVYFSDANKPINYKVLLEKGYGGNIIPKIYRNGVYFYSDLKGELGISSDLLFYDELTKTYYLAKNAYDKKLPLGTEIKLELIIKNCEALLYNIQEKNVGVYYQGKNILLNSKTNVANFILNNYFSYHVDKKTSKQRTLFFKDAKGKAFVPGELLPENNDQFYYYADGKTNTDVMVLKGKYISKSTFSYYEKMGDYDLLGYLKDTPTYVLPDYFKMEKDKIYGARMYDSKIDTAKMNSNTSSSNQNSSSISSTIPTVTCISGNCIDGYGEQKTTYNSTITGFFKNGKPNGFAKEVYSNNTAFYEGTFKDGLRDGYGFYMWNSDKQYYIGEWKAGKQHGYGYYKKGADVFQAGYYENGKQTRNMLTQNFINKQAVGNCIGDCNNGFGFYQYPNNDKYVGFFTNNKRNHVGAYTWVSGNAYMGQFYNGQLSGQASEFYKTDGTTFYGSFYNGKRQGLGVYVDKNQNMISKGYWENGTLRN